MRRRLAAGLVATVITLLGGAGPAFADHDQGRCYYEDCGGGDYCAADHDGCGDEGGRDGDGGKQTCFMACYITIPPGMGGGDQAPPEERTQSLFPPTPDKIIQGMQTMADAGINLGTTMARLVVDYVVTVFRFIV